MTDVVFIGDDLGAPEEAPPRRSFQDISAAAIHRFGGWAGGVFVYPRTEERAKALGLPWKPELVGQSYGDDPWQVARFYLEIFGWCHPYTLQAHDGILYQTSPFDVVTYHAGRFNPHLMGVLVTGDHRKKPPAEADIEVTAAGLAVICREKRWHPWSSVKMPGFKTPNLTRVLAHDDLPEGGTATPGKVCPGRFLEMSAFRERIAEHIDRLRADSLSGSGFVLNS